MILKGWAHFGKWGRELAGICIHLFLFVCLFFLLPSSMLFSASTDKTVAVWDSETGERVKRLKGHTSFVNSCYPARRGPQLVCTGSDDGTVKVGDVSLSVGVSEVT